MNTSDIQNIVDEFRTIDLVEMDQVQLMNRVDTKFTFSHDKLIEFLPSLKDDYRVLDVNGIKLSEYESLYYDGSDLGLYKAHHRKRLNRFKVRFRKYINSNIAFLEVKHKVNGRTIKNRIPVKDIPLSLNDDQREFVHELGVPIDQLNPTLWNSFTRLTLVSNDMKERLTLDMNLTFSWENSDKVIDNVVIAELKQDNLDRNSAFYRTMKRLQIRPLKVSKYCVGLIKMHGMKNIKYNRFKKKLLKLDKINDHAA